VLVENMRIQFKDLWRENMNPIHRRFFEEEKTYQIYPESKLSIGDKPKLVNLRNQMKNDTVLWRLVAEKVKEKLDSSESLNLQKLEHLTSMNDSDLIAITDGLKEKKFGCNEHCPFCGVCCDHKDKGHYFDKLTPHYSENHYFPGFVGSMNMSIGDDKPVKLLIGHMTCSEIANEIGEEQSKI
jgi:hypothetical protein